MRGIPDQGGNQYDAVGQVSAEAHANRVLLFHKRGLRSRRYRDLTAEKYALHIDGEGDGQWADIYNGQRVEIPASIFGQIRHTENLLRPVVDNAVAYHTTMPFRFVVDTRPDRESRSRALVDQTLINQLAIKQRWNREFAQALYVAMPYGSCPVHAFWRNDISTDPYEPLYGSDQENVGLQKGMIDVWVGDPWDTVYNPGATRNSLHMYTYGRTVPAQMVRAAFAHVPGVSTIQGTNRLPSASRFQRTWRKWGSTVLEVHGAASQSGGRSEEELIALLCSEIAPGIDPDYPEGRITVIAVDGTATIASEEAGGGGQRAVLLHDGPLPAGKFSHIRVYSANRFDDILGKPFVGDLDDLQVQLNQAISLRAEYIRRSVRPPLVQTGMMVDDTSVYEDDAQLDVDPAAPFQPYYLELPSRQIGILNQHISEIRNGIWTLGGYQAASRGEGQSGDAAAKVIALAKADDTIHGPTNQRFREGVEEFAGLCWSLFKEYADVPWLVEAVGGETAHLIEPWLDRNMISVEEPKFRLVSGFGATTESKANQLLQLVAAKGSDGMPLMSTRQFQAAWPDQSTYPEVEDLMGVQERRTKAINARIRRIVREFQQQMGEASQRPDFVGMLDAALMAEFPVLPDDSPQLHFEALATISQDENEDPMVRQLARFRQGRYQMWLMTGQGPMPAMPPEPQAQPQQRPAAPVREENPAGGTVTSDSIQPQPGEVAALTQQAQTGAF